MAARPATARLVKLLLDEMHAASAAVALRERNLDVVAVIEIDGLRGTADPDLLVWAASEGRAIVTENVRDFAPLAQQWAQARRDHAGLIFTNPRRFARSTQASPGNLIEALGALAEAGWPDAPSATTWL